MVLTNKRSADCRIERLNQLERNIKLVSEGKTELDLTTGNDYGDYPEKNQINTINRYVSETSGLFLSFAADIQRFSENIASGNIDYRLDASKYGGIFADICKNLNTSFDTFSQPVVQAVNVCKRIAVNDYTEYMRNDYKGELAVFAGGINAALDRLTAVQTLALKISKGDISELETYRSVGKRSDNDELVPAFTHMMEAIQALINETSMLSKAAVNGELSVRGDASKFHGEYVNIIDGINRTLDAVAAPMTAVTDIMTRMSEGAVHITADNTYNGQYKVLVDAVNHLLSRLSQIISEVSGILEKIAEGNLKIDAVQEFRGDYASITSSLKTIISSLNSTMNDIHEATAQVAIGANQIANSSQVLSQGAEEQASSVEEITVSVSELTKKITQNAEYAGEANKVSASVRDAAQKGNDQMKDMLDAMRQINEASSNISKIIKVIESIASQTNILALNAAVEAARAGAAGKGFAVVAGEVKSLAQKSAAAANETTALIESSIEKIKIGATIAGDTAEAFKGIYDGIVSASDIIDKIAAASSEQAITVEQINQAIIQVSSVIQTNSATAEESAAASEELSSQAAMLKEKVDTFKLQEAKKIASTHLNPELMNEIMKMLNEQRLLQGASAYDGKSNGNSSGGKSPVRAGKAVISLDDADFGKY